MAADQWSGSFSGKINGGGRRRVANLTPTRVGRHARLEVEEDAAIPLLLALEPEEFVGYYDRPISLLVPRGR